MSFYMQIANISGSATEKDHKGWITVMSVDFGVHRNMSTRPGSTGDREGSAPKTCEVVVTKNIDQSSPKFLEESLTGASVGTVTIHGTHSTSGTYVEYTLGDVIISHYDSNGVSVDAGGSDETIETIHLNFTKIEMKYIPKGADSKPGAPISAGYDLTKSAKL